MLQPEPDSQIEEIKPEVVEVEEVKSEPVDLRTEIKQAMGDSKTRARDESGKFFKQETEVKVEPEIKEGPLEQKLSRVPAAWSAGNKAKFNELPDWAKQEISRREDEVHKGFTKFDEERQFGKSLKDIISPYMPIIQAEGGTPLTAVQDLLNTAYILRTAPPHQKSQLFHKLAQQYGVPLGEQSPAGNIDPNVQALQQEVANLKGYINQTVTTQQQQEKASIDGQIESFAADPKNIYFSDVRNEMIALLNSNSASSLQDAYDMAVWARPDIRPSLQASQQQEIEAKRIADTKAKADAARKAGSSVIGSPGVYAPVNGAVPDRSLRDELRANFRAVE